MSTSRYSSLPEVPFVVESRWFAGDSEVVTYELDELLGTNLRALYQRRKGRDLFDLATALEDERTDPRRIIAAFQQYMEHGNHHVTARALRAESRRQGVGPAVYRGHRPTTLARVPLGYLEEGAKAVMERLGALLRVKLEVRRNEPCYGVMRVPDLNR